MTKAWKWIVNNVAVGGNGTFLLIGKGANKLIISSDRLSQLGATNWANPVADLLKQNFTVSHSDAIGISRALVTWCRQGDQLKFPNTGSKRRIEDPAMPW